MVQHFNGVFVLITTSILNAYIPQQILRAWNLSIAILYWAFLTTSTTICILAISPYTHSRTRLRAAQVSVFEWIQVGPKGQGHTYVVAVVIKFLMTAFIIMCENAPSLKPDTNIFALLHWHHTSIDSYSKTESYILATSHFLSFCTSPLSTLWFLLFLGRFHY